MTPGVKKIKDLWPQVRAGLRSLPKRDVLVGIPRERADRGDGSAINNATLGYIHERGAPEANIPARPWLSSGVRSAKDVIATRFRQAGERAIKGDAEGVESALTAAGVDTVNAIKAGIQKGIPPPLAESTIRGRRRRSKGSKYRRKARSASEVTPLIDTGNLLSHVDFSVRDAK